MLSEMVGTLCFGWCFTQLGPAKALIALVAFAAVGLPLELWLLDKVRLCFFCLLLHHAAGRPD